VSVNDQELKGQAGGAGEGQATGAAVVAGATGAEGAVTAQQPAAEGVVPAIAEGQEGQPAEGQAGAAVPAPAQPQPVDLTQMEEFRSWQAARDRREAQLQQQLAEGQRQRMEMQRQLDQVRLADADPEEVAAYYQQQMEQMRVGQEQQAAAAQVRAQVLARAEALLKELGLDPSTPGLEWAAEPSWDGLARLAASAAKVKALQAQGLARESKTVAAEAARAAKVEALNAAGVTKVSTATGAAAPSGENPIEGITDPDVLLRMGLSGKGGGR